MNKMRKLFLYIVLAMGSIAEAQPGGATALVIIGDSSWSCEQEVGDFRALARQAITSLEAGDYLEIISARASKPRILLAQTIRTGDAQEIKNIDAAILRLRSYFLTDASLPRALDMALRRLDDVRSKKQIDQVVVIVFTDGRMGDRHARQILKQSETFASKGWALYLTGTKNANRIILVEAAKNALDFMLLSEANPELWLRPMQAEAEASTDAQSELNGRRPALPEEEPTTGSTPDVSDVFRVPQEQQQQETCKDAQEAITPPPPSPDIASPNDVEDANALVIYGTPEPETAEPANTPALRQSTWKRARTALRRYWWLATLPFIGIGLGVLYMVASSVAQAEQWDRATRGKIKSANPHELGVLVARHGDRTYQLGPVEKVHRIDVGRAVDNAVRLVDEGIGDHHIRLFRRGNQLTVQNRSNLPIKVGTVDVKPRGHHRLALPGTVQLTKKVTLRFEALQPKPIRQENRSHSNEQPAEEALA